MLDSITLYCIVLHYITFYYSILHCITLCIALHYGHDTKLYYIILHCGTLYHITYMFLRCTVIYWYNTTRCYALPSYDVIKFANTSYDIQWHKMIEYVVMWCNIIWYPICIYIYILYVYRTCIVYFWYLYVLIASCWCPPVAWFLWHFSGTVVVPGAILFGLDYCNCICHCCAIAIPPTTRGEVLLLPGQMCSTPYLAYIQYLYPLK